MTQVARLLTDILPSVEVVDGTLSVDLEGVLAEGRREREEEGRPSAAIPQSHDPAGRPFPFRAQHCREDQGDSLHLDVDGSPPDVVLGGLLENDSLVFGTAAGLLSREVDEGSGIRDDGSFVSDGILVESSDGSITLEVYK
jgi:hypothetical protein